MSIKATSKVIDSKRFVPIVQLAYVTGKSLVVTTKMLEQAEYTGIKIGSEWWIDESEIIHAFEAWLRQRFNSNMPEDDEFANMESLSTQSDVYLKEMTPRINFAMAFYDLNNASVVAGRIVAGMLTEFRTKRHLPKDVETAITDMQDKELNERSRIRTIWITGFCLLGVVLGYLNEPEPNFYGTPLDELEQLSKESDARMQAMREKAASFKKPPLDETIDKITQEQSTAQLKIHLQSFKEMIQYVESFDHIIMVEGYEVIWELSSLLAYVPSKNAKGEQTRWPDCSDIQPKFEQSYGEPAPDIHRSLHIIYKNMKRVCN